MATLLMRARSLGKVTDAENRSLWMQMASAGYKMKEPLPLAVEKAVNFEGMFQYFLKDLGYSVQEIARLVSIHPEEFSKLGIETLAPKVRPLRVVDAANEA